MNDAFTALCIQSSEKYYDYLKQNNLGFSEIPLHEVKSLDTEKRVWEFRLKARIYDLDTISIIHNPTGTVVELDAFSVREYDADTGTLIVKFLETPMAFLGSIQARDVFVISSLLFLVWNVRKWFAKNGPDLAIPQHVGHLTKSAADYVNSTAELSILEIPSPEQDEAIKVALDSPLSYVWGPPGTGKTRLVLSQSVLRLVLKGCRVGVFAPTNLALEQAMDAILDCARRLGLETSRFLRLGAPSREFSRKHPEVCELQGIERRIAESERQIRILETVATFRRGKQTLNSGESMLTILNELKQKVTDRNSYLLRIGILQREVTKLDGNLAKFTKKAARFLTGKTPPEEIEREKAIAERENVERRLTNLENFIETLAEDFRRIPTSSSKLAEIQKTFGPREWMASIDSIDAILSDTREWLAVREATVAPYNEKSDESLNSLRKDWEARLVELRESTTETRMNRSLVVGMTLDLHIGRYCEHPPKFDHIFVDEAGYAPLIKTLSLFRHGAPVTMLGDHMQLPPIVEMDEKQINSDEYRAIRLWATGAVFCETAFQAAKTTDAWLSDLEAAEPNARLLKSTRVATLKTSRRFGPNLSEILDRLIYRFGFGSANSEHLRISVVDAPRGAPSLGKREAQAEVDRIYTIVERTANGDIAIIAPYKNQVALLGKRMRQLQHDDRILTIHRAQGREWDTVIISVVDGSGNTPWFTDTNSAGSGGAQVMNTAVSRARKHLIIVCDANYWRNKNDRDKQLISQLIDAASPLN